MNSICNNCSNKEEAISLVEKNKDTFKQIALDTIHNEGYNYDVNINIDVYKRQIQRLNIIPFVLYNDFCI